MYVNPVVDTKADPSTLTISLISICMTRILVCNLPEEVYTYLNRHFAPRFQQRRHVDHTNPISYQFLPLANEVTAR